MRVSGPLDIGRLEEAVRVVIERHEALRTVFRGGPDGTPRQLALPVWSFDLEVGDLLHTPIAQREAEMLALARAESRRPFNLESDLMLRVSAFRMGPEDHAVVFFEHHIAFDGWSDEQLFRELEELYAASVEGREPVLDALPIQYADWAAWERASLSGKRVERLEHYWRLALAGAPARLELPLDHARPQLQTFAGAHHHFGLPAELGHAVRALGHEQSATAFMVLVATFVAALRRWSGNEDIVLGSPIANRNHVELEHLIGLFSNTFVLRVRADGDPTLRELVERTREAALGAYEHQALPFDKLVELVRPPRDPSCNPIFQVNVRVRSELPPTLRLAGLEVQRFDLDVGFSRFDLAIEFQLHDDARVSGYLEYNDALFEDATARRFIARLRRLSADGLARPDIPISALDWEPSGMAGSIRGRRSKGQLYAS
jgi:hypothetical protein